MGSFKYFFYKYELIEVLKLCQCGFAIFLRSPRYAGPEFRLLGFPLAWSVQTKCNVNIIGQFGADFALTRHWLLPTSSR